MSSRGYASGTQVSQERSRAELDALLQKHGAAARGIMTDDEHGLAIVQFQLRGLVYRMEIPMPRQDAYRKPKDEPRGWWTWDGAHKERWAAAAWEQACRERWRQIVLLLKAKLELVRLGVSTAEREFLADLVLPNGQTVNVVLGAEIQRAITTGGMPVLALPAHGATT
jgi:hypothetical protein